MITNWVCEGLKGVCVCVRLLVIDDIHRLAIEFHWHCAKGFHCNATLSFAACVHTVCSTPHSLSLGVHQKQ